MRIVADENMPLVREYFSPWGEVSLLPGRAIGPEHVRDADLLLVRSMTKVDERLLAGSRVRFVGCSVIGLDHMDTEWLDRSGIGWCGAPGCNAVSVAEYVVCAVALLRRRGLLSGRGLRAGVVGVGNVGSRVAQRLSALGFTVLLNDPPRAGREPDFRSAPLSDFADLDLVCLHAPLVKTGPHPSVHLIGEDFLRRLKKGAVLLSAGRGAVVDFAALKKHGKDLVLDIDVWDPEPEVDLEAFALAAIATPHIAGHSIQGKWRGTRMAHESAARFLGFPLSTVPPPIEAPVMDFKDECMSWEEVVLSIYDPSEDMLRMKKALGRAGVKRGAAFDELRKDYPVRHEFDFPHLRGLRLVEDDRRLLQGLGLRLED